MSSLLFSLEESVYLISELLSVALLFMMLCLEPAPTTTMIGFPDAPERFALFAIVVEQRLVALRQIHVVLRSMCW